MDPQEMMMRLAEVFGLDPQAPDFQQQLSDALDKAHQLIAGGGQMSADAPGYAEAVAMRSAGLR